MEIRVPNRLVIKQGSTLSLLSFTMQTIYPKQAKIISRKSKVEFANVSIKEDGPILVDSKKMGQSICYKSS